MAHKPNGSPRVAAPIAAYGVAGAALSELLLAGAITVTEECLFLAGGSDIRNELFAWAKQDPVHLWILSSIDREVTPNPVQSWIVRLATQADSCITQRLREAGVVTFQRGFLGGRQKPVVNDLLAGDGPRVWLFHSIETGMLDEATAMLGALAVSTGLDAVLAHDAGRDHVPDWLIDAVRPYLPAVLGKVANAVYKEARLETMRPRR